MAEDASSPDVAHVFMVSLEWDVKEVNRILSVISKTYRCENANKQCSVNMQTTGKVHVSWQEQTTRARMRCRTWCAQSFSAAPPSEKAGVTPVKNAQPELEIARKGVYHPCVQVKKNFVGFVSFEIVNELLFVFFVIKELYVLYTIST